jgi:hypothetical protein
LRQDEDILPALRATHDLHPGLAQASDGSAAGAGDVEGHRCVFGLGGRSPPAELAQEHQHENDRRLPAAGGVGRSLALSR